MIGREKGMDGDDGVVWGDWGSMVYFVVFTHPF